MIYVFTVFIDLLHLVKYVNSICISLVKRSQTARNTLSFVPIRPELRMLNMSDFLVWSIWMCLKLFNTVLSFSQSLRRENKIAWRCIDQDRSGHVHPRKLKHVSSFWQLLLQTQEPRGRATWWCLMLEVQGLAFMPLILIGQDNQWMDFGKELLW